MSRCWHQARERRRSLPGDGGKRAVLREEHEISRKAIAQGRPGCFRRTCMLVCTFCFAQQHTRPRVRRAPGLPCALMIRGQTKCKPRAKTCRENATPYQRHCERSEAIHALADAERWIAS